MSRHIKEHLNVVGERKKVCACVCLCVCVFMYVSFYVHCTTSKVVLSWSNRLLFQHFLYAVRKWSDWWQG
ncbi:hypothetical protein SMKI_09G1530 [Saccharomyces mikatae IFO 1815]|uniref:Uncharacterized protein n=1 Tax=Saccharomyces mikatae IFO 1815 TaxID=226126 RepID=A0AA35J093_SACMI|nr:uncharacterized protein SMKI_09G1530 [Saccharomyces mikatae IFO 1815]CAI4039743.1 hypothetical protein SMKI_09G1530 [Saccharomyces mikatae IFO 1815]